MENLTHDQAELLWEVVKALFIAIAALASLVGGLATGFRWLDGRVTEIAQRLVEPLAARLARVEDKADAAHRRIDEMVGRRP